MLGEPDGELLGSYMGEAEGELLENTGEEDGKIMGVAVPGELEGKELGAIVGEEVI